MPNTLKLQSRKVALWNKRPVVVLQEKEHGEHYYHGVMIGPTGMTIAKALKALDKAFNDTVDAAVEKYGPDSWDDWNYDDVISKMKAAGFEEVLAAEWWEHRAN